jgi:chemotaxis protein methyltransferase CheR
MNILADPRDVERFRRVIACRLGLQFADAKLDFLGEVLQRRLQTFDQSSDVYLENLKDCPSSSEIGSLARELTVTETYFFRNNEQFRALAEVVLPERIRAQGAAKSLRVLSAGCASGEEAYSIAIVVREAVPDPSWTVSIRAVDLHPDMLEKAKRAHYSPWALRGTSREIVDRWFRPQGQTMILDATLRDVVTFEHRNLARDDLELWTPAAYDAIFCRNVIMYFTPEQQRSLILRVTSALASGGYLFLGHAETLRGLSDEFHLCHTHGTFYYQRKIGSAAHRPRVEQVLPTARRVEAAALPTEDWVKEIREASNRVRGLVPVPSDVDPTSLCSPAPLDLAGVLELLRQENFAEALACVDQLPREYSQDTDILLLKATLLANSGALQAAADTCRKLLSVEELNPGAHYLLALCFEHSGAHDRAAKHDRIAVHLDPGFAMPRLHLGLLARRAGRQASARRELARALNLLKHEEASRILLFGGGFNREALVALCRSALSSCGEQL